MAYIIIIFLVVLNLVIDYRLQVVPESMAYFDQLGILLVALYVVSLTVIVVGLFHWFYVRKTITCKSKIEHIAVIAIAVLSFMSYYASGNTLIQLNQAYYVRLQEEAAYCSTIDDPYCLNNEHRLLNLP